MEPLSAIVSTPLVDGAPVTAPASQVVSPHRLPAPGLPADCRGFRVDGPDGRIGVVRRLVPEAGGDRPQHLVVRTGLFIVRQVRIPVADVVEASPGLRRVVVRTAVRWPPRSRHDLRRVVRRLLRSVK